MDQTNNCYTHVSSGCSHVKECMLGLVSAGDNTSQLSSLCGLEQRQTHCSALTLPHSHCFILVSMNSVSLLAWSRHKVPYGQKVDRIWFIQTPDWHNIDLSDCFWGSLLPSHPSVRIYLPLFKHTDSHSHCSHGTLAWGQSSIVTLAKMGGLRWEGRKWTIL